MLISWVIFELGSVGAVSAYLGNMFAMNGIPALNSESLYMLRSNWVLLSIAAVGSMPVLGNLYEKLSDSILVRAVAMPAYCAIVLTVSVAYLVDSSFNPFLYFRF